jgi:hypothetical protein
LFTQQKNEIGLEMDKRKLPQKITPKSSHSTKPFNPNQSQRDLVVLLKSMNVKEEYICRAIINPETKKRLAIQTFRDTFAEELMNAKSQIMAECTAVTFEALKAERPIETKNGTMMVPDTAIRLKAADTIRRLCSKGVYENKYSLPDGLTPTQELDEVGKALREGLLNTYEADALVNIIKAKIESQKDVEAKGGIIINIDSQTIEAYSSIVKDLNFS